MEITTNYVDADGATCDHCGNEAVAEIDTKGRSPRYQDVCSTCLENAANDYVKVYLDDASISPDGWAAVTHTVRHTGPNRAKIDTEDVIAIGPSTEDVDPKDLPSAEEAKRMTAEETGADVNQIVVD